MMRPTQVHPQRQSDQEIMLENLMLNLQNKASLFEAARSLNLQDIKLYLKKVKDCTMEDERGWNIVTYIALASNCNMHVQGSATQECKHTQILNELKNMLREKFDELLNIKIDGEGVLYFAVVSDCPILLQWLLKNHKFDLNERCSKGGTPLGEAVWYGRSKSVTFLAERMPNINEKDKFDLTPLQLACLRLHEPIARMLHEMLKEKGVQIDKPNSLFRLSLMMEADCETNHSEECNHVKILEFLIEIQRLESNEKQWLHENNEVGCGLVQSAVTSGCLTLIKYLVEKQECDINHSDNDGDTALNEAAESGKTTIVAYLIDKGWDPKHKNQTGETPFLHACRSLNVKTVDLIRQKVPDINILCQDDSGNTSLHIVAETNLDKEEKQTFREMFACLFKLYKEELKNDFESFLLQENLAQQNMFHSLAGSGNLLEFVQSGKENFSVKSFLSVTNKNGLNILHVYAGKFALEELRQKLESTATSSRSAGGSISTGSQNSEEEDWKKIITSRVSSGWYKDYNCLHFACQTGHLQNIEYLLKNYSEMRLQEADPKCESACDVLIKHRHEKLLPKITAITFLEKVESLDNIARSFKLPDRKTAQQTLLPLCDLALKGIVMKKQRNEERYQSGRTSNSGQGAREQFPPSTKLLLIAMKEDSAEIFQSILALGFSNRFTNPKAGKDLNDYLIQVIKNLKIGKQDNMFQQEDKSKAEGKGKSNQNKPNIEPDIAQILPPLQRGFEELLKWPNNKQNKSKTNCFDLPQPTVLGIAIRSGRLNLAKEILLLDQLTLIPSCLQVIRECQRLSEVENIKSTCVTDLQNFATNVALSALDELYTSADENRMELLHKFMAGGFSQKSWLSKETIAPAFSFFESDDEKFPKKSIIDMAVASQCKAVIASEYFYKFTEFEWKQSENRISKLISPNVKFWLHFISFIVFLGFLTFYICQLQHDFLWADIIMYSFALSFWLQEILGVYQAIRDTSLLIPNSNPLRRFWEGYVKNFWNWVDNAGFLLLTAALILKTLSETSGIGTVSIEFFIARLLLSLAHVMWGLRLVSMLRAFTIFGPTISMLKTLITRDLLPFLLVFFILSISFGVFYFTLLHPDGRKYAVAGGNGFADWETFFSIFTRPLFLAFGHFEAEELSPCSNIAALWSTSNSTAAGVTSCTHPVGTFFYLKFLIFVYLILMNLTMLNLLIARFSLTVSSKDDVAYVIWRRYDLELLLDYKSLPFLPPPLTLLWIVFHILQHLLRVCCYSCRRCCNPKDASDNEQDWWVSEIFTENNNEDGESKNKPDCPKLLEYKEFLLYQALAFNGKRHKFGIPRKDYGSLAEKLKVGFDRMQDAISSSEQISYQHSKTENTDASQ